MKDDEGHGGKRLKQGGRHVIKYEAVYNDEVREREGRQKNKASMCVSICDKEKGWNGRNEELDWT